MIGIARWLLVAGVAGGCWGCPGFLAGVARGELPGRGEVLEKLEEKPVEFLSDKAISALGRKALGVRARDWKHAESEHFVYHFFEPVTAAQARVEAEYYYRVLAAELKKTTARWERKCHLFLFDREEDWRAFQGEATLDPWTGGIHAGGELFVFRDRTVKWKGHLLGHEIAHLVVFRFFGNGLPLWLNEGYAEEFSIRAYSAYFRARGYSSKPWTPALDPARYVPLADFLEATEYPKKPDAVQSYYIQSQRLVSFLDKTGREKFLKFFVAMAEGAAFETALRETYSPQFRDLPELERNFRPYASEGFKNVVGR